jgi:hypothetical protein
MHDSFFHEVYRYAPVGLVILNEDTKIVHINAFMLSALSLPRKNYKGLRFGSALRCASVFGSRRKCGETPSCRDCRFRRSFSDALGQGLHVRCAEVSHAFSDGGTPVVKTLRFSAGAVDMGRRFVVASFADISLEKQYAQLLTHELDLDSAPSAISPQSLIGIVASLLRQAGPDNIVSLGVAAIECAESLPRGVTGGEVLRRFAEIARQCTRRVDVIGRFGSGSFVFMFPGAGIHMAAAITRRIHDTMDAVFAAQGVAGVSFSAGFAELSASRLTGLTGDDILRDADSCLQKARQSGGSLFVSQTLTARLKD